MLSIPAFRMARSVAQAGPAVPVVAPATISFTMVPASVRDSAYGRVLDARAPRTAAQPAVVVLGLGDEAAARRPAAATVLGASATRALSAAEQGGARAGVLSRVDCALG